MKYLPPDVKILLLSMIVKVIALKGQQTTFLSMSRLPYKD
jgi:hypothetical protein